jgi:hypothetical protein
MYLSVSVARTSQTPASTLGLLTGMVMPRPLWAFRDEFIPPPPSDRWAAYGAPHRAAPGHTNDAENVLAGAKNLWHVAKHQRNAGARTHALPCSHQPSLPETSLLPSICHGALSLGKQKTQEAWTIADSVGHLGFSYKPMCVCTERQKLVQVCRAAMTRKARAADYISILTDKISSDEYHRVLKLWIDLRISTLTASSTLSLHVKKHGCETANVQADQFGLPIFLHPPRP